ncbi:MAG: CHC2 zinc finger domain-containing protein [Thalassobaculum sp.]|uniref:CHC2 zinc finger domain-containing protein n=1 Tax=Thalassobaculum sp. TaxID=2022740 RepID=UPI0032EA9FDE
MPFVDFAALKERVKIEEAAEMLGLRLKTTGQQLRGPCPVCESGGDRALVITPGKQLFYCFAAKTGGDLIKLVAHVEKLGANEAAVRLDRHFGNGTSTSSSERYSTGTSGTVPQSEQGEDNPAKRSLSPLSYLQAEHDLVQALGISPETCEFFGAGFAPKGIMRGRLAIPIHDLNGDLVAYCGRAVKDDQTPLLVFPKEFEPSLYVFNLHQAEGAVTTTNDPLDVLMEYECTGETTMVSFLHRGAKIIPLRKRA